MRWGGSARQPLRQILRHAKDLTPPVLARDQQSSGRQLLKIAPGGLMAHPMAVLVRQHCVAEVGMSQGMAQQRHHFAGLALHIGVQAADGLQDHVHLGHLKIGEVVLVALAGQKPSLVLLSGLVWARLFAFSRTGDLRYAPSVCFETFPFPTALLDSAANDPAHAATHQTLEPIGKRYHQFPAELMIANNEGLTSTYNRFHDPAETSPELLELRWLHSEMVQAVRFTRSRIGLCSPTLSLRSTSFRLRPGNPLRRELAGCLLARRNSCCLRLSPPEFRVFHGPQKTCPSGPLRKAASGSLIRSGNARDGRWSTRSGYDTLEARSPLPATGGLKAKASGDGVVPVQYSFSSSRGRASAPEIANVPCVASSQQEPIDAKKRYQLP